MWHNNIKDNTPFYEVIATEQSSVVDYKKKIGNDCE